MQKMKGNPKKAFGTIVHRHSQDEDYVRSYIAPDTQHASVDVQRRSRHTTYVLHMQLCRAQQTVSCSCQARYTYAGRALSRSKRMLLHICIVPDLHWNCGRGTRDWSYAQNCISHLFFGIRLPTIPLNICKHDMFSHRKYDVPGSGLDAVRAGRENVAHTPSCRGLG